MILKINAGKQAATSRYNKQAFFLFSYGILCSLSSYAQPAVAKGPGYTVQKSKVIDTLQWLGEEIPYGDLSKRGDTYPVTWATDNNIYTSAGDPLWGKKNDGLDVERITGDAPLHSIEKINDMDAFTGWGGCGPKPTGFISVKNTLYLAFQNMTGIETNTDFGACEVNHGYDASIVYSKDNGKTWEPDIKKNKTPMFPGRIFGAPAFINYGKDNRGAIDQYVYAVSGEGWCNGNNIRLGRVNADSIMESKAWQWVTGFTREFSPLWTNNLFDATPILTNDRYLGTVDMVYVSKLKKYLLLSWHFNKYADPNNGSRIIIYESSQPWGPFSLVYEAEWENNEITPYNPRLPLKWFDADKLEGWILFSGSWRNYGGMINTPYYRSHVRKFRLTVK